MGGKSFSSCVFYWDDNYNMPAEYLDNVNIFKAIHYDWEVLLFDDKKAKSYFEEVAPQLISIFDSLTIPAAKSDLFRLAYLYHEGGWYLDSDFRVKRHLDFFDDDVVLFERDDTENPRIINGAMGFRHKNHELLEACLTTLINNFKFNVHLYDVWKLTGPGLINNHAWRFGLRHGCVNSFAMHFKSNSPTFESISSNTRNSWSYMQSLGVVDGLNFNATRVPANIKNVELKRLLQHPSFQKDIISNLRSLISERDEVFRHPGVWECILSIEADVMNKNELERLLPKLDESKLSRLKRHFQHKRESTSTLKIFFDLCEHN